MGGFTQGENGQKHQRSLPSADVTDVNLNLAHFVVSGPQSRDSGLNLNGKSGWNVKSSCPTFISVSVKLLSV